MTTHFLQSHEWEEFQKSIDKKTWRIDDALVIKLPFVLGRSYLYSAGAVPDSGFVDRTSRIAKEEGAIFLKCEPLSGDRELVDRLLGIGFIKSKKEIQPQRTIILDITKSEEELLGEMHSKARYNIRVAEKHGLKIKNSKSKNFWGLIQKTAKRDKFGTHTKEYYEKLLELPMTQLFIVEYRSEIIAANIVIFYEGRATYLHGASDYEYRSLMAPYLLHWEIIRYAKENSFSEYDFWGIDEKKWPGVTRFKKGFGGKEVEYIGSYDYVFQPKWYGAYKLRQYLRNI